MYVCIYIDHVHDGSHRLNYLNCGGTYEPPLFKPNNDSKKKRRKKSWPFFHEIKIQNLNSCLLSANRGKKINRKKNKNVD